MNANELKYSSEVSKITAIGCNCEIYGSKYIIKLQVNSYKNHTQIDDLVYQAYDSTAEERRQVDALMGIEKRPT